MLSELQKLHMEMEDNLRRLADLAEADSPDAAALAGVRWKLSSAARGRMGLIDGSIFPHLLRRASGLQSQRLEQLKRQAGAASGEFSAHVTKWTLEQLQADWTGFRAASRHMRERIRQQIRTERVVLYPLLDAAPKSAASVSRCA